MNNQQLIDIEPDEFDQLIDNFIEHETRGMGEVDAPLFYNALETIYQLPEEATTVDLQAQIINDQLYFVLPPFVRSGIEVHENEIKINNLRLIIHLAPEPIA